MSFAYIHANCAGCGAFFSANPELVPSLGRSRPICESCVESINDARTILRLIDTHGPKDPVTIAASLSWNEARLTNAFEWVNKGKTHVEPDQDGDLAFAPWLAQLPPHERARLFEPFVPHPDAYEPQEGP